MPGPTVRNSQPATFNELCSIVARLRAPGGCPWDREQTHETLLPGLIEEAYEVLGAIRAKDDKNLREELGDLILQAVMHTAIAAEEKRFDIDEVIAEVTAKLIRRHPHVFGASDARDTGAVLRQWDAIKREEKGEPDGAPPHYLDHLPAALPALMRAQKAQTKAARVHFDWAEIRDVLAKVDEELAETKAAIDSLQATDTAEEIGDLLFSVVNLARKNKLDAEMLLQAATDKFIARFHQMENALHVAGKKLGEADLAELDAIWNAVKKTEARAPRS